MLSPIIAVAAFLFSQPLSPLPGVTVLASKTPQVGTRRAEYVVHEAAQRSGLLILADSTVADQRAIDPPFEIGTSEIAVEKWLTVLTESLPEGTYWVKLWLPAPPAGKRWTGDDVSRFAISLANLYGKVGKVEPERSEVLAQQVAEDKANAIKEALGLKPVYLVTRRGAITFAGRWQTTFGEMRLTVRGASVTGTYTANEGSISGRLRDGAYYFDWFEKATNGQGKGYFTLSEDGESFSGKWGNGDEEPASNWTGKRLY